MDSISSQDIPAWGCDAVSIRKTIGGAEWLFTDCDSGIRMTSAAPKDPTAINFLILEKHGRKYRLSKQHPDDESAKAAYRELRALSQEQIDSLVREVRERG